MLMLLEEGAVHTAASPASAAGLSFSSGTARLGGGVPQLLAGRPAAHVSFCDTDGRLLLTAHSAVSGSEQGPPDGEQVRHGSSGDVAALCTPLRCHPFDADLFLLLFKIFCATCYRDWVNGN